MSIPKEYKELDDEFSGFIFKMQANMNPGHRDCALSSELLPVNLREGRR